MAMGIDGLVSGLPTSSLIDALINAEAGTQRLLASKATKTRQVVTDLQMLNSSLSAIALNTAEWSKPDKLRSVTASSSSTSVSVTASATATAGTLNLRVEQLAQPQVSVSAAMTSWTAGPIATLTGPDGEAVEIQTGASLADFAANINAAKTGVTATLVASGVDPGTSEKLYRLQLSGPTGAEGAFSLHAGTASDVEAETAPDVFATPGAATVSTAQDATVTLWAGSPAAQQVTSKTNTFTDLLPGVTVTVTAAQTDAALTISPTTAAATSAAKSLVSGVESILASIRSKSAVSSGATAGSTTVTAGVFAGDRGVRQLSSDLSRAVMDPVGGASPSSIGISVSRTGVISLDETAFAAALAADPVGTQDVLSQIASRVEAVAKGASNTTDGSITQRITGQQSTIKDLETQIIGWDDRLATRRARLTATYAAMETALSSLQGQSNFLAAQLGATNTGSNK